MIEKLRDQGVEEAIELRKQFCDFSDPSKRAETFANLDKFLELREVIVQVFALKVARLAGPRLQQLNISNNLVPTSTLRLVDKYLINVCEPFHILIGSTLPKAQTDALEELLCEWLGKDVYDILITEMNTEVLRRVKELPRRPQVELRQSIEIHSQALRDAVGGIGEEEKPPMP